MKFLGGAFLALLHGAQANKFTSAELNDMVASGKIDKQRLIRNSVPAPRKLRNNYNGQYSNVNAYGQNNQNNQYGYNNKYGYNNNKNQNNQNNVNQYQGYSSNYQNNQANSYYQSRNNYNANNQSDQEYVQYGYNYTAYDQYGNAQNLYGDNGDAYFYNDDQDYNLPFNGNYTVRFNKCMSFTIEDADIVDDADLINYANTGVIVAQKSYVLFDIQECDPGSCVFDEANLSRIHMTTLEDFIASFIEYFPNKKEAYCQQCEKHYNYCTSGDGSFFDSAVFSNGGAFCYAGQKYEMINCGQCYKMGCLTNQGDDTWENVAEWVEEMAACKETEVTWKGYNLYTGLMCNAAGDGVEFGVFIDEECKIYQRQKAFKNVISNNDWQMLFQMPTVIEYMFTSSMPCRDDNEIKYMNAYQPVYSSNGNGGNNNGQGGNGNQQQEAAQEGDDCQLGVDINDSCLDLFQYNLNGISLADCMNKVPTWVGYDDDNDNDDQNDQNIEQEWSANGLYAYELSVSDLSDMGKVCHIIANKYAYHTSGGKIGAVLSTYKGNHQNVYNADGSGSMFNYNAAKVNYYSKNQHDEVVNSWGVDPSRMSILEKTTFWLLGLTTGTLMVVAAVRVYTKIRSRETVVVVDKNLPLIS